MDHQAVVGAVDVGREQSADALESVEHGVAVYAEDGGGRRGRGLEVQEAAQGADEGPGGIGTQQRFEHLASGRAAGVGGEPVNQQPAQPQRVVVLDDAADLLPAGQQAGLVRAVQAGDQADDAFAGVSHTGAQPDAAEGALGIQQREPEFLGQLLGVQHCGRRVVSDPADPAAAPLDQVDVQLLAGERCFDRARGVDPFLGGRAVAQVDLDAHVPAGQPPAQHRCAL
jgi:hypothetical protein